MHIADGGTRLNIEVDPINPQAWKAEPFYSTFKTWAAKGNARGLMLLVLDRPPLLRDHPLRRRRPRHAAGDDPPAGEGGQGSGADPGFAVEPRTYTALRPRRARVLPGVCG